ncbi:hypothetical protein IJ596_08625, partial [bacterium]|nr:hypothetical protein [bacterium]
MKKLIISLILLVPLLTGCASVNTRLTINKDETAAIETAITYKGDLSKEKSYNGMTILENYAKFLDENYVVYPKFGQESRIYARKRVKDIRYTDLDLKSLGFKTNNQNGKFVEVKKNLFVKLYKIDMYYDYNLAQNNVKVVNEDNYKESLGGLKPEYYFKYFEEESVEKSELVPDVEKDDFFSNMDDSVFVLDEESENEQSESKDGDDDDVRLTFSVKLPSFAAYNNADISLAPDTYLWKIRKDGVTNIKIQYIVY